jgi:magnesium chelatase family protein
MWLYVCSNNVLHGCPCGYFGDSKRECRCNDRQIQNYRNKISGPLLDRIDIHIEVPGIHYKELSSLEAGESSEIIRKRVITARNIQVERYKRKRKVRSNADMGSKDLQKHCKLSSEAQDVLKMAITDLNFSARAYDRIIKVSRTIADLASSEEILQEHVNEAIQYRTLDRQLWV